jgi:hypothetical protein
MSMPLLIFNRRVAWVMTAAVLWMLAGLTLALGGPPPRGPQEPSLFKFSLGPPPGGLWLPGDVRSIVEEPDKLTLTLEVPPDAPHDLRGPGGEQAPPLPAGLELRFVDRPPMDTRPGPPEVILNSGPAEPIALPGGRLLTLTDEWVVKYGRGGVRVLRRTPELGRERLKRWLKWEQQQPPPPRPGGPPRPPDQQFGPPDGNPPPGPPEQQNERQPLLKRWLERGGENDQRRQLPPGQ